MEAADSSKITRLHGVTSCKTVVLIYSFNDDSLWKIFVWLVNKWLKRLWKEDIVTYLSKRKFSADLTKLTSWPIKNLPALKEPKFRVCRIPENLLLDHTKNQLHPAHNSTAKLKKIDVLRISYRPHPDIPTYFLQPRLSDTFTVCTPFRVMQTSFDF